MGGGEGGVRVWVAFGEEAFEERIYNL